MSIEIISAGSSSSGNAYIVKAGEKRILIDVGIAARRINSALCDNSLGFEKIDAVFITHEHCDHIKSIRTIANKCHDAIFYASAGTISGCKNFSYVPEERRRIISPGDRISLGEVSVNSFELSHDAQEPMGYSITSGNEQMTLITDTGIITEEMFDEIRTADKLVLESNHDLDMLMYGNYPYDLKCRIKGDCGHLSNEDCGKVICKMLADRFSGSADGPREKLPAIMLAHLSENNNAPFYARQTVESILKDGGFRKDRDYSLTIASKEGVCYLDEQ